MNNFYGNEERRIEKIKPIIEIPPELKRILEKRERKRMQEGGKDARIISRKLNKNIDTK